MPHGAREVKPFAQGYSPAGTQGQEQAWGLGSPCVLHCPPLLLLTSWQALASRSSWKHSAHKYGMRIYFGSLNAIIWVPQLNKCPHFKIIFPELSLELQNNHIQTRCGRDPTCDVSAWTMSPKPNKQKTKPKHSLQDICQTLALESVFLKQRLGTNMIG